MTIFSSQNNWSFNDNTTDEESVSNKVLHPWLNTTVLHINNVKGIQLYYPSIWKNVTNNDGSSIIYLYDDDTLGSVAQGTIYVNSNPIITDITTLDQLLNDTLTYIR